VETREPGELQVNKRYRRLQDILLSLFLDGEMLRSLVETRSVVVSYDGDLKPECSDVDSGTGELQLEFQNKRCWSFN
jgi:hypothetical protein